MFIMPIFLKENPHLNGMPRDLSEKNVFNFIRNDVVASDYLRKDCVQSQYMGTHVLSNIF